MPNNEIVDKQISELPAASTLGDNDLLPIQQGQAAKKLSGKKLSEFVYASAADRINEVNQAVADSQEAVDELEEQKDEIAQVVASMAELGTDTTLTTTGMAADAKAAGDRIKEVENIASARFEQKQITGVPIASFDDGADNVPVKSLTVSVDPVQNLHGLDNPYPAGGSDNKMGAPAQGSYTLGTTTLTTDGNGRYTLKATGDSTGRTFVIDVDPFTTPESGYMHLMNSEIAAGVTITLRDSEENVIGSSFSMASVTNRIIELGSDRAGKAVSKIGVYKNSATSDVNLTFSPMILATNTATTTFIPNKNICPITGWTGAKIIGTGKNLCQNEAQSKTENGVTFTVNADKSFSVYSTGATGQGRLQLISEPLHLPAGDYTISQGRNSTLNLYLETKVYRASTGTYSYIRPNNGYASKVFTLSDGDYLVGIYYTVGSGETPNFTIYPQIELGSTATDYEPFGNVYSITFPNEAGTVYGGTLDVTSGKLTVTKKFVEYNGTENWTKSSSTAVDRYLYSYGDSAFVVNDTTAIQSNMYKPVGYGVSTLYGFYVDNNNGNRIAVNFAPAGTTSKTDFQSFLSNNHLQVVGTLQTPIEYTLTPTEVKTLLALNNIWADTGDVDELTYYRMNNDTEQIAEAKEAMELLISARHATEMKAPEAMSADDLIIVNDILYVATQSIASGATLTVGTNVTATTVEAELKKKVSKTTTVNGKALSSNVTLTAEDIQYDGSAGSHTSGSIGAELSSQSDRIDDLKNATNLLDSYKAEKVYGGTTHGEYVTLITGKGWNPTNGTETTNDKRARTNPIIITPDIKNITCTSSYLMNVYANDAGAGSALVSLSSNWETSHTIEGLNYKYLFVIIKRSDEGVITADDLSNVLTANRYQTEINFALKTEVDDINNEIAVINKKAFFNYPSIEVGSINVNTGGDGSSINRARTGFIPWEQGIKVNAKSGNYFYVVYYNSSKTWTGNSGEFKSSEFSIPQCGYYRLMLKSDTISDFTNVSNTFVYTYFSSTLDKKIENLEEKPGNYVYTIGENDNVAEIITEAMKHKGSIVYIDPYEHDCIEEWKDFYGDTYFSSMSSTRGLELENDIHIIGRSGHKLKCYYTGDNDYVMEHFSLFNNCPQGSGYILENVCIDVKKIRYCVHDERGEDAVPYKVRYDHCIMSQDQTGSTWDASRACIGGGLGLHGDIVVEDCIFDTVTSSDNMDSIAYHNSNGANAQNSLVIKNCYCKGDSTIQLASYGSSTAKTKVLVANCSLGSEIEELDWTSGSPNLDIYYINNVVRT